VAPPTVLFLDVGGVCLTNGWDHVARREAADRFDLDFQETERRHGAMYAEFERGELELDDYLRHVVFFRDRPFSREDFVDFMRGRSRAHADVLELVRRVRDTGTVRLATINNESRMLNEYRIGRFGLDRLFEAFFSSCYLGVRKPSERIFRTALDVLDVDASEALFLDDREENVVGARTVGLRAEVLHGRADAMTEILEGAGVALS